MSNADTLLELHDASRMLQRAFTRAVEAQQTELAEAIRRAQQQVTVSVGVLVTTSAREGRRT